VDIHLVGGYSGEYFSKTALSSDGIYLVIGAPGKQLCEDV